MNFKKKSPSAYKRGTNKRRSINHHIRVSVPKGLKVKSLKIKLK